MNKAHIGKYLPANPDARKLLNQIATNLLLTGGDQKAIAVTSCHDGEGKTTIAVQLAYTLTREGKKVIVVDAAAEDATPFEYDKAAHGGEGAKSIADFIAGTCDLSEMYCTTEVRNLYLFPLQPYGSESSESMEPEMLSALIDRLSDACDFVIIDTPSAGQMNDAVKIANVCNGIVLVVKYKSTKKKDVKEIVLALERSGTPILGCIINEVKFDCIKTRKRYRFFRK